MLAVTWRSIIQKLHFMLDQFACFTTKAMILLENNLFIKKVASIDEGAKVGECQRIS